MLGKHSRVSGDFFYFGELTKRFYTCKGKRVKIEGFEEFEFAMIELTGLKFDRMIECTTGMILNTPLSLPIANQVAWVDEVIKLEFKEAAEERLFFIGGTLEDAYKAVFKEKLQGLIKQHGLSPRYRREIE